MWSLPKLAGARHVWVEPTDDVVDYVAANLRDSDRRELEALTGDTDAAAAARLSVAASRSVLAALSVYGEPLALLGVSTTSLLHGAGSPWFVATPSVLRHRRALIEQAYFYTESMLEQYHLLENFVDARNRGTVEWLRRLGFHIESPAPHGATGALFHRFWKERTPCVSLH